MIIEKSKDIKELSFKQGKILYLNDHGPVVYLDYDAVVLWQLMDQHRQVSELILFFFSVYGDSSKFDNITQKIDKTLSDLHQSGMISFSEEIIG